MLVYHRAVRAEGYRSLNEGQAVEFNVRNGPKGLQAENVESLSFEIGRPMQVRPAFLGEDGRLMSDELIVEYLGFTVGDLAREYSFVVRDRSGQEKPREYTVTIANEAFVSHRARYQDGPIICSLRLRRELATNASDRSTTEFCITDSELDDYKSHSSPRAANYFQKREPE